jgi:hypothetical protein
MCGYYIILPQIPTDDKDVSGNEKEALPCLSQDPPPLRVSEVIEASTQIDCLD